MTNAKSLPQGLYLIRHGETDWSPSYRHAGRTDIPLTAQGEQDAIALGEKLRSIPFAHVYTSPLQRARRTCELVGLSPKAEIEPDLMELNYGAYEGLHSAEIYKTRPDWNVFRDGSPSGEMSQQISDRADRLITHFRKLNGNIALFSHCQFGCAFAARWIGLPVIDGQHFTLNTTSLSVLGYAPDHADTPVIALWNWN